jgi:hypothetical protein
MRDHATDATNFEATGAALTAYELAAQHIHPPDPTEVTPIATTL